MGEKSKIKKNLSALIDTIFLTLIFKFQKAFVTFVVKKRKTVPKNETVSVLFKSSGLC